MRIVRRIIAILLVPVVIVVATLIGTVAAVVFTPGGHRLLAGIATRWISASVSGRVEIGSVGGSIFNHIVLGDVVVRDSLGQVVVSASRVEAGYSLPGVLSHRLIFRDVQADSLVLHLVKYRGDGWNYERIFHIEHGPPGGPPPPLVSFLRLTVNDGTIRIDVPTTPGEPRQPVSRNGRQPPQPRIESSPQGPIRVYTATDFNAFLPLLRISTPRHDPILAQIGDLRMHFSDPNVEITQLAGRIITAGDSLRFNLDSISLPSSRFNGRGAVRWPDDTLLFDFELDAPRVALRDLWWIQPDFPDWTGSGHVVAKARSTTRTDYRLSDLDLHRGNTRVTGDVTVLVDAFRGVGMRGLDLALRNTPVDVLRPYLDTLPISGTLTGHATATGFLDSLALTADVVFTDALVLQHPTSHLNAAGVVHLGSKYAAVGGAVFQQFRLRQSQVALATIHRLVPTVLITGNLNLIGTLDGPWQNATLVGTAEHDAPNGAISRMNGTMRLDTRTAVLGLGLDVDLDRLSFDALRSGYPALAARGGLTGHVTASGNLDSLELAANVRGEIGGIVAHGTVQVDAPSFGADSLRLDLQRVDAAALLGTGTSTSLNGTVRVRGSIDSGAAPSGTLQFALDRSRIGGATVDGATGLIHADHGLLQVDSAAVIWRTGHIVAHGTLGWAAPDSGTLHVVATANSLAPFDSLVRAVTGVAPDTIHPQPLTGTASATLAVRGAIDNATIVGKLTADSLALDDWHADHLEATLRADSLGQRGVEIALTADTAGRGVHVADQIRLHIAGRPDSLRIAGSIEALAVTASGGGLWQSTPQASMIALDSLSLEFPHQSWRMAEPDTLIVRDGSVAFVDTLLLRATDGSGRISISGATPGPAATGLDAHVVGLDLLDVFGVLQRDTTALDGYGSLDLHLGGTRSAPIIHGSVGITGPVIGDVHAPAIRATFDYSDRRLHSDLAMWKTGQEVLSARASLPLDLALEPRDERKLPGTVDLTATADSVDMLILGALIPGITHATGTLSLEMQGHGTWSDPDLKGEVSVHDGGLRIPTLGVRFAPINGLARFVSDSLVVDSLVIGDAGSNLHVTGSLRFANLSRSRMNLDLRAESFLAIDAAGFLTVHATGKVHLSGPVLQPVLTGNRVTINNSVIYFTDLITKAVIDLEDPMNAAFIDTVALHRRGLQTQFSNRFIDSLRIVNLPVHVATDVWLRSAQANIELEGDITVNKDHKLYNLTGQLSTDRGTYTLQIGPINREFRVDQGTVRYFGIADLNPDVQIQAHYQVRTVDGDDFNVVATITGKLREPKVTLTAPGRDLSPRDIISYILFGRSEFQLAGSQQNAVASSLITVAAGQLFNEFQNSLVNSGLIPSLSTVTLRPGFTPGAITSGAPLTQLAAGFQFGRRWFVTFDAGICLTSQSYFQQRNFGASIDYRLSREFRLQVAAEPVETCSSNRAADVFTTLNRYQFGANLLWQKDY